MEREDGSLEMIFMIAGTAEIKRWLLAYGAEVEVLGPPSLRAEIAAVSKNLQELCEKISAGPEACCPIAL